MVRTRFCELLGIEIPVVQASLGPWSAPELVASVSNTGAIGSLGTVLRPPHMVGEQIRRVRELTDRPFIVNFSRRPFGAEQFGLALEARVPAVSLAHGDPGDLPKRAHDAGSLFIQMVNTVRQAREAADRGADVIIAQGSESGGFAGEVSTLCLAPQVVAAVRPIPVLAAGGIADGRGLAVALLLGAQGVNIGTRFVASAEAGVSVDWQRRIVQAESEDTVKLTFADAIIPPAPGTYEGLRPRVLRTEFVDWWNVRPAEAEKEAESLSARVVQLAQQGRVDEVIPFTGQTAGMIHDVLPASEIVRRIVLEAEEVLRAAPGLAG